MTAPKPVPGFDISADAPAAPSKPAPLPHSFIPKPDTTTTVVLRGIAVRLDSDVGRAFIVDCCRNREKIFSDARIQEKYNIDSSHWDDIVKNKALRLAISAEGEKRMLNGTAAQEAAAKNFTESPEVMGSILRDQKANPRHRVEASKELRATARFDDEKPGANTEHFTITINLGADQKPLVIDCGPPKQPKENTDAENEG
jgi:hypothetical protein